MTDARRGYPDLHEHLETLKQRGLLLTIDRPIDKDAELHPLVRWQFVGGIEEHERKAFLFTHVIDGRGRRYAFPVVVGALAANRAIYSAGMRTAVVEGTLEGPILVFAGEEDTPIVDVPGVNVAVGL